MIHKFLYIFSLHFCLLINIQNSEAQETFSIVAIDTLTGEIGSAGASCLDLFGLPYETDLIADVVPGRGAINTQSYYIAANQTNARTRLLAGDNAQQVLDWLFNNDVEDNPSVRQYGVVSIKNGRIQAAAFTGENCFDYKGHRIGSNYSIQGNILLGPEVLDKMEDEFIQTKGNLACKLMASLQGANFSGADSRCSPNGTSSLFAFLKVSKPNDEYTKPSIKIGVKTRANSKIEPIDSLQIIFNTLNLNCSPNSTSSPVKSLSDFHIYPNPFKERFVINFNQSELKNLDISLRNIIGNQILFDCVVSPNIVNCQTQNVLPGIYFLTLSDGNFVNTYKLIKN
ncbi:MAG TPA: DUF1028 domain-containing protein [Saprospiraceae bacterium]|nr:DUF1028 domain-containing protein [Saprospiraceae bacterium]